MEYLGGGYKFDAANSTVAYAIDVAIALATFGMTWSTSIATVIVKKGLSWLQTKGKDAMVKAGINVVRAGAILNLLNSVSNFTVGNGLAYLLDCNDSSGRNGRIQY